jgi:hypothetical protein
VSKVVVAPVLEEEASAQVVEGQTRYDEVMAFPERD